MNPAPSAFKPLEKPIIEVFVRIGKRPCLANVLHRPDLALEPASWSSRRSGVVLAVSFLSLRHSLLKGNDRFSNLMYCTIAFFATMLTVHRVF